MLIPGNPPTSPEKNRWNPEIHRKFSQNPKTCTQDFKKKSPGHTHTHTQNLPGHTPRISKKIAGTHTQKNRRDTLSSCEEDIMKQEDKKKKKTQTQTEAKTRREDQESDKGKTTQVRRYKKTRKSTQKKTRFRHQQKHTS